MCNYLTTDKTMKQTYFAPSTVVVKLNTENSLMLTVSVDPNTSVSVDPNTSVGGSGDTGPGQLTRGGGWSSENWSDAEMDEE